GNMRKMLEGLVSRGKMEAKAKDDVLARVVGTTRLEDLKDCDLVVEAITENQPLKNETFAKLDRICPPGAILASNTSSCNVTAMAAATRRPGQVLGLHFFNPVPLMQLVAGVRTILTHARVAGAADGVQGSTGGRGRGSEVGRQARAFISTRSGTA